MVAEPAVFHCEPAVMYTAVFNMDLVVCNAEKKNEKEHGKNTENLEGKINVECGKEITQEYDDQDQMLMIPERTEDTGDRLDTPR